MEESGLKRGAEAAEASKVAEASKAAETAGGARKARARGLRARGGGGGGGAGGMAISLGGAAEYGESVPASDDDESSGEGSRACHAAGAARAEERGRTKALAARAERLRRLRDVLSDLAADSPGRARRGRARADELASERGVSDARAPAQVCVTPVPARTPQRGHGRGSASPALSARGTLSPTELAAAFVTHAEAAQGGVRARARVAAAGSAHPEPLLGSEDARAARG